MNFRIQINFKQIPVILLKCYKIIVLAVVLSLVVGFIYYKTAPKLYVANVLISPPKLSDAGSGLSPAVAAIAGLPQQRSSGDVAIGLLQTREIHRLVDNYIDLDERYRGQKHLPYSADYLTDWKTGFLNITVTSESAIYSRDVANFYIVALGKQISNIAINKALQKANFYTQQLEIAKKNRDVAESNLLAFKSVRGITAGSQDVIVASMISSLQSQYVAQQTALDASRSYLTTENPDYKSSLAQLDAIKARIDALNNTVAKGKTNTSESNSTDGSLDSLLAPNYVAEYEALQDEYNLRTLIYSVLIKQYEANNLDLQSEQDPVTIDVIDPPVVPTTYSSPQLKKILSLLLFLSLGFSVLGVLIVNYKKFINNDNV